MPSLLNRERRASLLLNRLAVVGVLGTDEKNEGTGEVPRDRSVAKEALVLLKVLGKLSEGRVGNRPGRSS